MIDIKKTALIVLILTLLTSIFSQYAYASNNYDHDALMQYEGYGEAMYESIVEQTTFITGQYTENKDYVNESINEIKGYWDFWNNEREILEGACAGNLFTSSCLGTLTEAGAGYALTLGDIVKNFFNDYDVEQNYDSETMNGFEPYFTFRNTSVLDVKTGFYVSFDKRNFERYLSIDYSVNSNSQGWVITARINNGTFNGVRVGNEVYKSYDDADMERWSKTSKLTSITAVVNAVTELGIPLSIHLDNNNRTPVNVERPDISNTSIRNINNYLQENPVSVPLPQLKPRLVCSNGTTVQMSVSGSTFLAVDGSVMLVNQDGTAEVNGEICNLNWQKPTVQYDPVTGKPVITQPDGTKTDLETGTSQVKPPDSTDLEGCEGVLCGIGKLLDGLGSVVSSITGMVKALLDGLVGLFVPKDLGFISEEFSRITKKLNEKIAITDSLKEAITSVFDGGGGNPLANISINLPITNEPLTFGNVSFIEEGVPILRKVISAIVVLYTIAYVYRKITGRGGVMER